MSYEVDNITELVELMASCERLGLFYIIQKDYQEQHKWFRQTERKIIYRLQVIEYVEGEPDEQDSSGNEGKSETGSEQQ